MSDRPSTLERLSTALSSSDLSVDADHRGDVDFIVALGMAASRNGSVAAPLTRLHLAGSATELKSTLRSVTGLVRRMNAKRNWRLNGQAVHTVALQALAHHIVPVCQVCQGRQFELQKGAPVLSTRICKACHGTGRRPIQKKHRDQVTQVISALEMIDNLTERAVARLIR